MFLYVVVLLCLDSIKHPVRISLRTFLTHAYFAIHIYLKAVDIQSGIRSNCSSCL